MAMHSRGLQYYLDNFFKFPKEIKNDIVYCQRSLKTHIKVHQMVIDVFQQEEDADPAQKQRILDEIESEIYEINAEQHFLFLRLRRMIDEFYKMLKRNDVSTDDNAINAIISREVVPLINDSNIEILPATVLFRNTEQKLIEKYFEIQKEKTVYEIQDSDEDNSLFLQADEIKRTHETDSNLPNDKLEMDETCQIQDLDENSTTLSQMSLLKPISQRLVGNNAIIQGHNDSFPDASNFLQMNFVEVKSSGNNTADTLSINEEVVEKKIDFPVSKNVKISRLNLRQALNKARTENMVAKAAANLLARSGTPSTASINHTLVTTSHAQVAKKYDIRPRVVKHNSTSAISKERNTPDLNSSSDDSNPEPLPTPSQPALGVMESGGLQTLPEHYGQEMFFATFSTLYSHYACSDATASLKTKTPQRTQQ